MLRKHGWQVFFAESGVHASSAQQMTLRDSFTIIMTFMMLLQGLDVRMDLSTGKKMARNIQQADRARYRNFKTEKQAGSATVATASAPLATAEGSGLAVEPAGPGIQAEPPTAAHGFDAAAFAAAASEVAADAAVDGAAGVAEIDPGVAQLGLDPSDARMAQILLSLPEPEPELSSAISKGLSKEQLHELLAKVWKTRQDTLRKAFEGAKTEAQQMQALLVRLLDPVSNGLDSVEIVEILESLEFFVATVHNAEDFHSMGGLLSMTMLLNSSHAPTAAHAAWVLGTAVKGQRALQQGALDSGAAPALLALLDASTATASNAAAVAHSGLGNSNTEINEKVAIQALKSANKAVYALTGLMRFNQAAQSRVTDVGGLRVFASALNTAADLSVAVPATSAEGSVFSPLNRQARTLASKLMTMLSDLVDDDALAAASSNSATADSSAATNSVLRFKLNSKGDNNESSVNAAAEGSAVGSSNDDVASSGPTITRLATDRSTGAKAATPVGASPFESQPIGGALVKALKSGAGSAPELCAAVAKAVRTAGSASASGDEVDVEISSAVVTAGASLSNAPICARFVRASTR